MGCGFPRGGGRHQLSGGPSLLTSTPVSCRRGEDDQRTLVVEEDCGGNILFQIVTECNLLASRTGMRGAEHFAQGAGQG